MSVEVAAERIALALATADRQQAVRLCLPGRVKADNKDESQVQCRLGFGVIQEPLLAHRCQGSQGRALPASQQVV
jgi:hypothetical protein